MSGRVSARGQPCTVGGGADGIMEDQRELSHGQRNRGTRQLSGRTDATAHDGHEEEDQPRAPESEPV